MAYEALATLLAFLEVFRPALSQPSFGRMRVVFSGWVLTSGVHAVTSALVAAAIPGRKHHEAFHRFFSRGTWDPDRLGWFLFECALKLAGGRIQVALDDTLAPKKGPHVFGIGSHLDAVRSTRRFRVFCFGHCWVVLAVLVPVPFARRMWALPVLFRLYRTVKECETKGHVHRKKTELAREMLDVLVGWAGEREVEVSADSAYCNDTITRGLSPRVVLFGAMRPDAVLTAAPAVQPRRGRRRKRGRVLAKPEARACDGRYGWQICEAVLYGRKTKVRYKTYCAQWYRACGERLLRIVVVRMATGAVRHRVFFSTDPSLSAPQVLETYAGRWAIEVCFRDLKQTMGFADSTARKQAAVERTAPFVGFIYTTLVLWFAQCVHGTSIAVGPLRPWYRHKRGASFADILRTAQRALSPLDVLDPRRSLDDLRKSPPAPPLRLGRPLKRAA